MALQLAHTSPETGAAYPLAYHRVNALSIDTLNKRVIVHTAVYVDAASRTAGLAPVAVRNHEATEPAEYDQLAGKDASATIGKNPAARAYVWLKASVPEYATALDV